MLKIRKNSFGFITYFLLVIFLGYYISITSFYHEHLVNGEIIVHSHPYRHNPSNKSPFQSHQHSADGYATIQLLNEANWSAVNFVPAVPVPLCKEIGIKYNSVASFVIRKCFSNTLLRAPPVC